MPFSVEPQHIRLSAKNKEAIADLSLAIASGDELSNSLSVRGKLYEKIGDYPRAIADFSTLIKMGDEDEDTLYGRAQCYVHLQQYDKAIADLTEALKVNRASRDFLLEARAKVYDKMGRKDLAQADRKNIKH